MRHAGALVDVFMYQFSASPHAVYGPTIEKSDYLVKALRS